MQTIAFCNRKGGSGKTTTSVHVAAGLALMGHRVLLVDTDPQAHATLWLTLETGQNQGLYEVLTGQVGACEAAAATAIKGLYLLSGNKKLADFEADNLKKAGAAHILRKAISPCHRDFEYVIFDTPPYLSLLMLSVIMTFPALFVTVPLQFLALEGLTQMARLTDEIGSRTGNMLKINGIIPVMFNRQLKSSHVILKKIKEQFGTDLLCPYIRQNIRLAEAPGNGSPVYICSPDSPGSQDYSSLTKAIRKRVPLNQSSSCV